MSNSISFTWGLTQLEDLGFVKAYNFMLRHYAKLGVARNEMLLLLHLASYKYDSPIGQSRPSQTTIAKEMGYEHRQSVARIIEGLVEKGMLKVTRSLGKPHIYDASPFAKKAFAEWRNDTCNENVTPTCNENPTPPATEPLHEEEKEEKEEEIKSPKNGDKESSFPQEYTYVEPGEEFEGVANKRKHPKWSEPKTEFEKRVMSAIHNKKHWQKHDRKSLTDLRVMEKSMTPLSSGREKYPTGWIEHVLEDWYLPENRKPSVNIPLKGFITACNNADRKAKWIAENKPSEMVSKARKELYGE